MIFAALAVLIAPAQDTTDILEVFRTAIAAAYDTMRFDSARLKGSEHVSLDHESFRPATAETGDWSPLASALGPRGTPRPTFDCGAETRRCPIISLKKLDRMPGGEFKIEIQADISELYQGKLYLSLVTYIVHLVPQHGQLIVESVKRGTIT